MKVGTENSRQISSTRSYSNPHSQLSRIHGIGKPVPTEAHQSPPRGFLNIPERSEFKINKRDTSWARLPSNEPVRPIQFEFLAKLPSSKVIKSPGKALLSERSFVSHSESENYPQRVQEEARKGLPDSFSPKAKKGSFSAMLMGAPNTVPMESNLAHLPSRESIFTKKGITNLGPAIFIRPLEDNRASPVRDPGLKRSFRLGKGSWGSNYGSHSFLQPQTQHLQGPPSLDSSPRSNLPHLVARGKYYFPHVIDFIEKAESDQPPEPQLRDHFKELFDVLTKSDEYSPSKFIRLEAVQAEADPRKLNTDKRSSALFVAGKQLTLMLDIDETLLVATKQRPSKIEPKYHCVEITQGAEEVKVVTESSSFFSPCGRT